MVRPPSHTCPSGEVTEQETMRGGGNPKTMSVLALSPRRQAMGCPGQPRALSQNLPSHGGR